MAKTETETQDFMNVESFSQLPFIRPALSLTKDKGIRLFGIEFATGADDSESLNNNIASSENTNNNTGNGEEEEGSNDKKSNINGMSESSRRFECNYCCRNFPTSQALGGHQNAHKRERQHAKHEHLQSAMVMYGGRGGHVDSAHVYGLMNNYTRAFASHHHQPTWNTSSYTSSPTRLYGSSIHGGLISYGGHHQSTAAPINGSPLGLWRVPSAINSSSFSRDHRSLMNPLVTPAPLFTGQEMKPVNVVSGNSSSSQSRGYVYGSSSSLKQDHVAHRSDAHAEGSTSSPEI